MEKAAIMAAMDMKVADEGSGGRSRLGGRSVSAEAQGVEIAPPNGS